MKWVYATKENDLFLTNIRATLQSFFKCNHDWEHRTELGEEEHGINPYKRYCKICGKIEWAFANQPQLEWKNL